MNFRVSRYHCALEPRGLVSLLSFRIRVIAEVGGQSCAAWILRDLISGQEELARDNALESAGYEIEWGTANPSRHPALQK